MTSEARAAMFKRQAEVLAMDVIHMAAAGGMPDSYWHSDGRIARACKQLRWTVDEAIAWVEAQR